MNIEAGAAPARRCKAEVNGSSGRVVGGLRPLAVVGAAVAGGAAEDRQHHAETRKADARRMARRLDHARGWSDGRARQPPIQEQNRKELDVSGPRHFPDGPLS